MKKLQSIKNVYGFYIEIIFPLRQVTPKTPIVNNMSCSPNILTETAWFLQTLVRAETEQVLWIETVESRFDLMGFRVKFCIAK